MFCFFKTCRLCMVDTKESGINCIEKPHLCSIIEKLYQIKICTDDKLSKQICSACFDSITAFHFHYEIVKTAEKSQIQHIEMNAMKNESSSHLDNDNDSDVEIIPNPPQNIKKEICNSAGSNTELKRKHLTPNPSAIPQSTISTENTIVENHIVPNLNKKNVLSVTPLRKDAQKLVAILKPSEIKESNFTINGQPYKRLKINDNKYLHLSPPVSNNISISTVLVKVKKDQPTEAPTQNRPLVTNVLPQKLSIPTIPLRKQYTEPNISSTQVDTPTNISRPLRSQYKMKEQNDTVKVQLEISSKPNTNKRKLTTESSIRVRSIQALNNSTNIKKS